MNPSLRSVVVVVVTALATPAGAMSAGVFGASGENANFQCRACHGSNAPAPTVTLSGADATVLPGSSLLLTVRVQRAVDSPGLEAGFGIATTSAGIFVDPDADLDDLQVGPNTALDNQATHKRPKAYDADGTASWTVALSDLREGRHRIFVGGNDVDDNSLATNDRAVLIVVPLLVCDPSAADDDGDSITGLCDVCAAVADPGQEDRDNDGVGDACDLCPDAVDRSQADVDGDGLGDACDEDTNECELELDNCDVNASCTDLAFRAFTCACLPGFEGNGRSCLDVNECAFSTDDCAADATCENTEGSFTCTCKPGFAGDGRSCTDVDECQQGSDNCAADATCENTAASFSCSCLPGFDGDGLTCSDVDECSEGRDDCAADAACKNAPGAFSCSCLPGFDGDGRSCTDVDECATSPRVCDPHALCQNEAGDFSCACDEGYSGDGFSCVDIDECAHDPCGSDEQCQNHDGAFACVPVDPPACCAAAGASPALIVLLGLGRRRRVRAFAAALISCRGENR